MEIPRWLNLCVQTQPWCSERLWLALARTWTSPAIGGDLVDISIQVYYCQLPGCLGISLFQGSSWRLCRHCSFQLSRDDSPLDVSHGPRHGQHLCYEGGSTLQTGLLATIISQDLKLYFMAAKWERSNSLHGSCGASDGGWSSSGSCQCHTWAGPSVNTVST